MDIVLTPSNEAELLNFGRPVSSLLTASLSTSFVDCLVIQWLLFSLKSSIYSFPSSMLISMAKLVRTLTKLLMSNVSSNR